MITALYEARLLAVLVHAYVAKAMGDETAPAGVDEVTALQTRGTVDFTVEQRAQIDSWYERTKRTFQLVGAKQEVTLENLPAEIDLACSKRLREQCEVKLQCIHDISLQLEASVKRTLEFYRAHTLPELIEKNSPDAVNWESTKEHVSRFEVRIADIRRVRDIRRSSDFCEEDLKSLDKVLKQLGEWAEEQHGFEKLPDNVEGLAGANSGYPVGY